MASLFKGLKLALPLLASQCADGRKALTAEQCRVEMLQLSFGSLLRRVLAIGFGRQLDHSFPVLKAKSDEPILTYF